jgi:serine/threonine protein kinase
VTDETLEHVDTRFAFVKELGRGVLGEAYEVIDEVRMEHVVLKVFLRSRPRSIQQFRLDFQSLTRLNHVNLARFHHLVDPISETHENLQIKIGAQGLAITEEFVDGYDLLSFLGLPPTPEEIDRLDSRRHTTGDVPSAEVLGGEVTPDPLSLILSEDGLPQDEYAEYALLSVKNADATPTLELPRDTLDAESVVEEFTRESKAEQVLDLVLMRLEKLVPQIIAGLEHLHRFHKVHASLRPSNIRVTRSGLVKLTDYGIVQHLVYATGKESEKAIPLVLTPENIPFLAPEVARGEVGAQSDSYALGCVLFEAIAGQSPYERMEWTEGDRPTLAPPPLADCVRDCPASWASVVDGLLSRSPDERPTLHHVLEVVSGDEARPVLLPATVVEEPTSFVGRREVLERIKADALQTASDHTMRYVQLEGEVGIGKSNLLRALGHWLGRRGWVILKGRFFDPERRPFQGWDGVVESIRVLLESLPPMVYDTLRDDIDAASCMFPQLGGRALGDDAPGRLSAITGLRNILERLGEERPILLVLHDLQWSSWDSASLLLELLAQSNLRCLIVGTWQHQSRGAHDHLLRSDLTLTLFHANRVAARGYDAREAADFARISGALIKPSQAQAVLNRTHLNPLLLRELSQESTDINAALESLMDECGDEHPSTASLLRLIYSKRMADISMPERAILDILAVASAPLADETLSHVVEQEVSSKVIPTQGNVSAIEESLAHLQKLRLVRAVGTGSFVLSQVPIRQLVLDSLEDRTRARMAGRIAEELRHHAKTTPDELFMYRRESGRVADAVDAAVEAAETAETRYAYHRAASIWRWLLENEESIPDWAMIRPTEELARVEQLAGRHAMAAELYRDCVQGEKTAVDRARIRLRETHVWLQASKLDNALESLKLAFQDLGMTYETGALTRVGLMPHRLFQGSAFGILPGMKAPTPGSATQEVLAQAEVLYFALDWNVWFDPRQGELLESRLGKLAEESGDALLLGMSRLKAAELHAAGGIPIHKERCLEWIADAKAFFAAAGETEWAAQALVHEGLVRMWYDDFGLALKAFDMAEELGDEIETHDAYDHRRVLYLRGWTNIRRGELFAAEYEARRILHTYRNDGVGRVFAYRLLAELALLRGETDRAERVIDGLVQATEGARGTKIQVEVQRLRGRLEIARGRPEVAVGQFDVIESSEEGEIWNSYEPTRLMLLLALGQSLAALATRQKYLNESLLAETLVRLKKVGSRLEKLAGHAEPRLGSEIFRLLARTELLQGQAKRALKYADKAIHAVGAGTDPLTAARCAEARGNVLQRLDKSEAKTSVEQAWAIYGLQKASYPLVLEGWPVPKPISALKDD